MLRFVFINMILFCASLLWSQDEFVDIEINPTTVEKGQPVTITLKTNTEGNVKFELPDEFVQSGPTHSGMSSSVDYSNGKGEVIRFSFQKFSGYFDTEGEYKIGPIKIQTANGEIESKSVMVKVHKLQNMISEDPSKNMDKAIFGIIEQSKKEIYEGQPIILEGKVYSQIDILQVENFNTFKFEGPAEIHSLQNSNQVSRQYEVVSGKDVVTFKIGKSLIFPDKTGNYEISPFEIILLYDDPRKLFPERAKIRSNTTKVRIKPLPDGTPNSFIGAVGHFDVSASFNGTTVEQGKVVELNIRVFGHGNLHNIEAPKLKLPKGMVLYGDPEVEDSITFSSLGAEGMKTFTYYIQANNDGNIQLEPIEISYFDLESESYTAAKASIKSLTVTPSEDVKNLSKENAELKTEKEKSVQPFISRKPTYKEVYSQSFFKGVNGALLVSSPILLSLLFGFFVRIKTSGEEEKQKHKQKTDAKRDSLNVIRNAHKIDSGEEQIKTLYSAIIGYLANEWNVNKGNISREFLDQKVAQNKLDENLKTELIGLLNELDEVRYGFSGAKLNIEELSKKTLNIIEKLD
ncbi:MAG: hypothetical protein COA32_00725 [Fluviicola sp.]|nr:MAG: hypothetical protein COA32_00725 [Fluviicola sp.]